MPIALYGVEASMAGGTILLGVGRLEVTLDEGWAPYGQAALIVPMPDVATRDALDPRLRPRVQLTLSRAMGGQERTFDLLVTSRVVDSREQRLELRLATDEQLLINVANVLPFALTSVPELYATSLRDLVTWVILPACVWPENLTLNGVPGGWVVTGAAATLSYIAGAGGPYAQVQRVGATGSIYFHMGQNGPDRVTPGQQYTYRVRARFDTTSADLYVRDGDGNAILTTVVATGTAWTDYSLTFTAPASGRVYLSARWYNGAAGQTIAAYQITLTEGPTALAYAPPTLEAGTADASLIAADDEALAWKPGQAAWDYLEPLIQVGNLRLFCDEQRRWFLVEPFGTVPGLVNITGATVAEHRDTVTVEGEEWYDAVVIRYQWTNSAGDRVEQYDTASLGKPTNTLTLEYDRAFPGAGAAERLLMRARGRGRVLDVAMPSSFAVTPGMGAQSTMDGAPIQYGYVTSVTWDIGEDQMRLGTRGLVDTPEDAWLFAPEGLAWEDVAPGVSWADGI